MFNFNFKFNENLWKTPHIADVAVIEYGINE